MRVAADILTGAGAGCLAGGDAAGCAGSLMRAFAGLAGQWKVCARGKFGLFRNRVRRFCESARRQRLVAAGAI
jgi:hypothetical protein